MLKWPPDSGWWFETFCRWQGFSDREVKSSYYVPRIKPCINIHAWGGGPSRDWLASVDLIQFTECCHWQKANLFPPPQRKEVTSTNGSRNTKYLSHTFAFLLWLLSLTSSTLQHSNWWMPALSLVQCGAWLMMRGSAAGESPNLPSPNAHLLITNEWEGMERSHGTDDGK